MDIVKKTPQLWGAIKKHYFERITAANRFAPTTLHAVLAGDHLFDQNFSIKENLEKAIANHPIDAIERFLRNLIEVEAQNGRILAVGEPLGQRPGYRVLVRPLGICIVAETSHVSSVEAAINLGSIEKEFYWATSNSRLMIEYLSTLKTTVADSLYLFNQKIFESPKQVRATATKCI